MKIYKLTDENNYSLNNTKWGEGVIHSLPEIEYPKLCSSDLIHAYTSPELAIILNYIHSDIKNPVLWQAEGDPIRSEWDQVGCFSLQTIKKISLPEWYIDINIRKKVYHNIMKDISDMAELLFSTYTDNDYLKDEFVEYITTIYGYLSEWYTLSEYYIYKSNSSKEEANTNFRLLLYLVYDLFSLNNTPKWGDINPFYNYKNQLLLAECAFIVYQNLFCKLDESQYYVEEHIACILESGSAIGLKINESIKRGIENVTLS